MSSTLAMVRRLELVAALSEQLLREGSPVGNDLAQILGATLLEPPDAQGRAMLELALWAKRYAAELGPEQVGVLVTGELVSLWREEGKTRDEFSAGMVRAWDSVCAAIDALELDSSEAPCSRSH